MLMMRKVFKLMEMRRVVIPENDVVLPILEMIAITEKSDGTFLTNESLI